MTEDRRFTVERARAADLEAVAALEAECFTNPWPLDMRARDLGESGVSRLYLLRPPEGGLAGFCACWLIVDELHINTIAVDPARRRLGLATRLMAAVFADAVAAGARRATLEVRRSNVAAQRLYERLGFRVVAVRPGYYERPAEDALILWHDDISAANWGDMAS